MKPAWRFAVAGLVVGCRARAAEAPTEASAVVTIEPTPSSKGTVDTDPGPPRAPAVVDRPRRTGDCCKGMNDCRGKGNCKVEDANDCAGQNDCRGKGGCKAADCAR